MKLSVSLLDILTCGFGGILLLFLTTITTWQEEFQQTDAQTKKQAPQLVVVIHSKDFEKPLFELDSEGILSGKWETGKDNMDFHTTILTNFAVLYCNKKYTDTDLKEVKLEGLNTSQTIVYRVIKDGKEPPPQEIEISKSSLSLADLISKE